MKTNNIKDKVYNYKTKHKYGFVRSEIEDLLKDYPDIDKSKFDDALYGITCMRIDDETVIYHIDIEKALYCGTEKRNLTQEEWD